MASSIVVGAGGESRRQQQQQEGQRPPQQGPAYPSSGGGHMDKRVLIIYTGGTMGMLPKADGSLDVFPGHFTELMLGMEEMKHPGLPFIDILEYEDLLDSACLGPKDWSKFATDIERHYFDYDGFVLVHGTDTMAYTASALVRACLVVDEWMEGPVGSKKGNRSTN